MQLLGECRTAEPAGDLLPITQDELCRAFLVMLDHIGITRADMFRYWDEAQAESQEQSTSRSRITDYIMRRDRASRWKNICGLSSSDIDMLLGHRTATDSRYECNRKRKSFACKENLDRLAELNANYFYDNRKKPDILLHQADGTAIALPPCLQRTICNNSEQPMTICLSGQTLEPGDCLILCTSATSHVLCADAAGSVTSSPAIGNA